MKKLLYIIGFLMFSTVVIKPLVAMGQETFSGKEEDVPFSSARIFSKVVESTGADPNADWGTSFGASDETQIGQNLYIMVYQKTENGPQQDAFKQSAAKYGMTEADLVRILHNDYSPLVAKKPGLRQEELQIKIADIQQEYKKNKELLELNANIKAGVEPTEIFANGDLSDSGFDLINDLNIIEELLFLKVSPIDVGSSYTEPDDDLSDQGQANQTEAQATGPEGNQKPGEATSPITDNTQEGTQEPGDDGGDDEGFNPNACFQDDKYGDALAAFDEKKKEDANYKDTSNKVQKDTKNTSKVQSPLSNKDDFFPPVEEPEKPPVQAAEEGQWTQEEECDQVLCLEINFVTAPATSKFASSDNCIACHAEKINDILKTVINHSLVPTKAPGNLGESAECKKAMGTAFGSVSMNFYAVSMPVKTPLNDDLVYGTNIEDEWKTFCSMVNFFPFDNCGIQPSEASTAGYVPPPSLEDRAAKDALAYSAEGATYEDVSTRISQTVAGYQKESAQQTSTIVQQKTADESIVFFHPLQTEMDQMNQYFINYNNILHSLHEAVDSVAGPQSCTDIKNKKECE